MSHLEKAIAAILADQARLNDADAYAENLQPEVFASARLRRLLERTGKKFRINWCRTVITSVLNRLEIAGVSSPEDESLDEDIARIWADNDLGIEAKMFMERALTWGECYAMVWPPEEEDEETSVDVYMCSPRSTKIFYDEESGRQKIYAARLWREETTILVAGLETVEERWRVNLLYDDRIEKYVSVTPELGETDDDFQHYIDSWVEGVEGVTEDQWPVPHDMGEIPVFHFRTQKTYGRPEHIDGYGPQDMLNKLTATQMATNDFQGFPQRYALLGRGGSSDFEGEFDADFSGDSGPSALVDQDDRMSGDASMSTGPGEMWLLKADKVGQFQAADPDVFLKPMSQYIRALATTTSTPLHHFEGQSGAPSGESLRVAEAPLVKKVEDRQVMFGNTWDEIYTFGLKLMGHPDPVVKISWQNPQSQDDLAGWALVKAKLDAGIPLKQALVEHGYTPEIADSLIEAAKEEAAQEPAA